MNRTEFEVRFLDIDTSKLIKTLRSKGAQDLGESMLEEVIFYDPEQKWRKQKKLVRLRQNGDKTTLTYKHHHAQAVDGATEIELEVNDMAEAESFLKEVGLRAFRHQQKLRHTFKLSEVTVDIDTWPKIPTYVELEGPSEKVLRQAAEQLELDWKNAVFINALEIIENVYSVPAGNVEWFTFNRYE